MDTFGNVWCFTKNHSKQESLDTHTTGTKKSLISMPTTSGFLLSKPGPILLHLDVIRSVITQRIMAKSTMADEIS